MLGIWLVLALLAAATGFVYGWLRGPEGLLTALVLSPEQNETIFGYGPPDAWMVADGPTSPDGGHARLEEWYHFDDDLVITFVNGTATDAKELTPRDELLPSNYYDPFNFDATLWRTDVEQMLGEQGTLIDDIETVFPNYRAYVYPAARLLIGFLDDQFYTAQTY